MKSRASGCRKCRQIGEKLCSKVGRCALERRPTTPGQHGKRHEARKLSEYGKQLLEKQKVRFMYGVGERQFKRFFVLASKRKGVTGEILLSTLESRLDNVLFRLKMAVSRSQARQMVVHGHVIVNGKRVKTPSFIVSEGNVISIATRSLTNEKFMTCVVQKRLNIGIKVPDWLELQKKEHKGIVLREPARTDIKNSIEEHLVVELYSK